MSHENLQIIRKGKVPNLWNNPIIYKIKEN